MNVRPPIGTRFRIAWGDGTSSGVTVVPTGKAVPGDEVNVMRDGDGSITTVSIDRLGNSEGPWVASTAYIVVENAGYDVGRIVQGVFTSREKADAWITVKLTEHAREVRAGNAPQWGAPSYDVEEHPLDPGAGE